MLEAAGVEVFLVNASHVKGVPGRKTDMQDAAGGTHCDTREARPGLLCSFENINPEKLHEHRG